MIEGCIAAGVGLAGVAAAVLAAFIESRVPLYVAMAIGASMLVAGLKRQPQVVYMLAAVGVLMVAMISMAVRIARANSPDSLGNVLLNALVVIGLVAAALTYVRNSRRVSRSAGKQPVGSPRSRSR
jgi:uncharacterized membrane protein